MRDGQSVSDRSLRPDRNELGTLLELHRDASWIDTKVELTSAQGCNPVEPLNIGCKACGIYGTWREAIRGEGEATLAGTTKWFIGSPCRGEQCSQVRLKRRLKLVGGRSRVRNGKRSSEISDSLSKSDGKAGCGGHNNSQ